MKFPTNSTRNRVYESRKVKSEKLWYTATYESKTIGTFINNKT